MKLLDRIIHHALPAAVRHALPAAVRHALPSAMRRALPSAAASLDVAWEPGLVLAPVSGTVVELGDVPDPVFSTGMLGPGTAVAPSSGTVFSPVSGVVSAMVGSGHAFDLVTDDGLEVLVHVGIDTVVLHGAGFVPHVAVDGRVVAGQPLVDFDRDALAQAGFSDVIVVTLPNAPELTTHTVLVDGDDEVSAGDVIIAALVAGE